MFTRAATRIPRTHILASNLLRITRRSFTVLGIESSADDTCAAIVTSDRQILSNVVVKQHDLHESFGGIHPFVAIEGHQKNLARAVRKALGDAKVAVWEVDGIAYTRGPGIGGCLSVGSNAAKTLAASLNKPLVGVHHMQAHALTPFLTTPLDSLPTYPFLTLLISGGHTLLLLSSSPTSFKVLATTCDESIGRVFDKVARMIGVPWGEKGLGASLEEFVSQHDDRDGTTAPEGWEEVAIPTFPIPMRGTLSFSYACLHSTLERYLSNHFPSSHPPSSPLYTPCLPHPIKLALARSFQSAAIGQLEEKLLLGLRWCKNEMNVDVRHVVISGGVASNLYLRRKLGETLRRISPDKDKPIELLFPPPALCTDNAVMIAWASMDRFLAGDHDDYSIELRSKWPIEELDLTSAKGSATSSASWPLRP
ncbi:hypothetical protein JAAARDRAFT_130097 [Jaapia argillacea MUCL 33604]|uniref:N(6)-L-threonylcarbamoyladenine synthase n=1 Tax=Jaapia argillacea MUCL 33604 TaxID=933084 RepID=A0A067PSJ8_9AGAM|nr:hypothetical protein JAAARDRAFT_130097 [Jaapia argillacea MUCL 33604]